MGLTLGDLQGAQGGAERFERIVIAVQKSAKDIVGDTVDAEGPHEGR
jgi:hypothetical protein